MSNWVFSSQKTVGDGVHLFIGAVTIAKIRMVKRPTGWVFRLDLMNSLIAENYYPTFGAALQDLHKFLNSPPAEEPGRMS